MARHPYPRRRRKLYASLIWISSLALRIEAQSTASALPKLTGQPSTNNAIPSASEPTAIATAITTSILTSDSSASSENSSTANTDSKATPGSTGPSTVATITGGTSATNAGPGPTRIQSTTVSITGGGKNLPTGGLTGLPKLGVSYPPISVPNVADAPYMQHSSLPEGTVFIAVGAILALFAFGTLLWRAVQAYLLKRSVRRAAMAPHVSEKMAYMKSSARGNYDGEGPLLAGHGGNRNGSTLSLAKLRNKSSIPMNPIGPARRDAIPNSPRFFSPTAPVSTPPGLSQNRATSAYLPAGYYASGAALPGGQPYQTHVSSPGGSRNQSLTRPPRGNLMEMAGAGHRASASYVSLNMTATPPDSPLFPPHGRPGSAAGNSSRAPSTAGILGPNGGPRPISLYGQPSAASTSTLDFGMRGGRTSRAASMQLDGAVAAAAVPGPPGGRTPSAMLDEMFSTATEPPRRDRTGEWRGIDLDR